MPRFNDEEIPDVRHRLNEVYRTTALQYFLETPQWHAFAKIQLYIDFIHAHSARILEFQQLL
jgi:hypothetical protein